MVAHPSNLSAREVMERGSKVQGHLWRVFGCEDNLSFVKKEGGK